MSKGWESVYKRYLNDIDLPYNEMGKLMEQYRPKKLYRYMRFDDYWKKNVFEGQLYLAESSNVNDPFDCLVYIDREIYKKYMFENVCKLFPLMDRQILKETVRETIDDEIDEQICNIKKKIRIACFTESNVSPLMWSHYAESHKGFCVEYDLTKLPEGYTHCLLPVIYSNQRYNATDAFITNNKNLVMNPYYFKSLHWRYEKEWRMVITEDLVTDGEYYADFSTGISGIYIGIESMKNHKEKVEEIIKQYSIKGISVHEMYIEFDTYDMKSKIIN